MMGEWTNEAPRGPSLNDLKLWAIRKKYAELRDHLVMSQHSQACCLRGKECCCGFVESKATGFRLQGELFGLLSQL